MVAGPEFYTTSSCSGRVVLFWQRDLNGAEEAELEPEPEPDQQPAAEEEGGGGLEPLDERAKASGGANRLTFVHSVLTLLLSLLRSFAMLFGTGRWLYITHDEPTLEGMQAAAGELPAKGLAVFKQEPFLLHVRCCSMEAAAVLYRLARECGLRESGVAPVGEFPLCALRSTALKMDAVVGSDGRYVYTRYSGAWMIFSDRCVCGCSYIVSQEYLALTIEHATQKMRANIAKLNKLERCLRSSLAMHLAPSADGKPHPTLTQPSPNPHLTVTTSCRRV